MCLADSGMEAFSSQSAFNQQRFAECFGLSQPLPQTLLLPNQTVQVLKHRAVHQPASRSRARAGFDFTFRRRWLMAQELSGMKIAIIATQDFEEPELTEPKKALEAAG